MIKPVFYVTYLDSFGYADTLEEAKAMEDRFKSRYNSSAFQVIDHQSIIAPIEFSAEQQRQIDAINESTTKIREYYQERLNNCTKIVKENFQ